MLLLLPILAPVAGGIFVFRQKKESVRNRLVLALMLVTAGLVCAVCLTPEQTVELLTIQGRLHLALRSDLLAKFFLVLITCIWAPITLFAFPYIRHEGRDRQFFGFYTMTLGILAGLAMAKNFVTLYMFFEMMSLITVPLVLHSGTAASRRAGFQYLGYSVFGAGMALAGYFFVAYYMATPDFIHGGAIDPVKAAEHRPMLLVVYFLMIVGFGCKAGMMPMQAWLPAAHPVAPAPASAVLSGVITKGGVLAILRITYYMYGVDFLSGTWPQYVLLTLALCTVFVGSMLAYREKLLKRRLAYSTVSQVSYVLFGLFLFTPGGRAGRSAPARVPRPGQRRPLPGGGGRHLCHQPYPGGPAPGHRPPHAGDHVVLYPGRPVPHWHPAHARLSQQVVSGDGGAGGGFPGLRHRRAGGARPLRPADGGLPAAHRHGGLLPRPRLQRRAEGSGKNYAGPHAVLFGGVRPAGPVPRPPHELAGRADPQDVLNSAGKEAHACFDFSICPSSSPC